MNLIKWAMERTMRKYKEYLRITQQKLDSLPKHSLQMRISHGSLQFYKRAKGDKKNHYIRKAEAESINDLAQHRYYLEAQKKIERYIRLLERIEKADIYQPLFQEDVLEQLWTEWPPALKNFEPLTKSEEEFKNDWEQEAYEHLEPPMDGFETKKGDKVRSKSEKMIANELFDSGIAYHYEPMLMLNDRAVFPDFAVLNARTHRVIYWEHLGLMDKEDYSLKMTEKVKGYMAKGYWIGRDLILTYETKEMPFKGKEIKDIIESMFK